ncbi:hypothetical protein [Providencia sp. PROV268]|uniref:hypothetical protein n=1 Tax=Providencia sp. PROV268 TaxID=2949956 RepID=UPI0023492B7A|nr:hypothetical protein [Providencia sp. PROV268]
MEIEELLVAIGVDTTQAAKIKDVVAALGAAAAQIAIEANKINGNLDDIGDEASDNLEEAGTKADNVGSKISKLKLIALGVGAVIGAVSAKVIGFIDGALAGAKDLAQEKGLLFDISKKELAQADEYQAALKKTGLSIDSIKTKIALNLVPQLTKATKGFNEWLTSNKELIANGLTKVIQWGAKVIQVVINSVKAISMLIEKTIGWKAAVIGLVAILAVLKRAMLMAFIANPITWVIAGIVGLMLLLDDLMVYLEGGDSLFGEFWGSCISWIKSVKDWWSGLSKEFKASLKIIGAMLAATFGTNIFVSMTKGAGLFGKAISFLISPIKTLIKFAGLAGKAFMILGRALLMNPIGIVIGLVVGLGYVLYDLYKWLTTGESAFGDFWKAVADTWEKIKSFFKDGVKSILMSLGLSEDGAEKAVTAIGEAFSAVFALIIYPFTSAWEFIKGLFSIWGDDSTSFTEKLGKTFSLATDIIKKPFMIAFEFVEKYFNKLIGGIKDGIASVKSFFGFGNDEAVGEASGNLTGSIINAALLEPSLPNLSSATTNNKSITINQGDIQVQQSIVTGDPQKAASLSLDGINKNGYKLAEKSLDSVLANGR